MPKGIIVLYHNDCTDGFSAAWAAWKKLGNKADYVGIDPHCPDKRLKDKEIYMVDLIYRPISEKLIAANKNLWQLITHISNQKLLN